MKIATILFTYNRAYHTKQVIDSLSKNTILPEKLFIFHDGLKNTHKQDEWLMVKKIIHGVDFCPVEIIESDVNKGLAKSVIDGLNYVLEQYDAVIVLEDDCVTAPNFMRFMYQALKKYEMCAKVYCVSGYAWNIELEPDEYDAYFNGRISSWGWGTWKDRWEQYTQDNDIVKNLSMDKEKSRALAAWGKDLPAMLDNRIKGKNNSWAVYWALDVIEKNGLCLCPYKSLVQNVGFDGTGVHCYYDREHIDVLDYVTIENFRLPEADKIKNIVYKAFCSLYGSRLSNNEPDAKKENAVVYALGNFFNRFENELCDTYNIVALCDKNKQGCYYAGYKIIGPSDIVKYSEYKIIIMLQDKKNAVEVQTQLAEEYNIPLKNIIFGVDLYKILS